MENRVLKAHVQVEQTLEAVKVGVICQLFVCFSNSFVFIVLNDKSNIQDKSHSLLQLKLDLSPSDDIAENLTIFASIWWIKRQKLIKGDLKKNLELIYFVLCCLWILLKLQQYFEQAYWAETHRKPV